VIPRNKGFTLIELVIVIAVIGILATIALTAVSTAQARARDAQRLSDIGQIQIALKIFFARNDRYPDYNDICHNPGDGGWNDTYYTAATPVACVAPNQFIYELFSSGIVPIVPVDPLNTSTYYYSYYRYNAGDYGCTRPYFVLGIRSFEALTKAPSGGGWKCPPTGAATRDWQAEFAYVVGDSE
jgi:prepilin-type N-terminal cleavage/methylation domain-containing protein